MVANSMTDDSLSPERHSPMWHSWMALMDSTNREKTQDHIPGCGSCRRGSRCKRGSHIEGKLPGCITAWPFLKKGVRSEKLECQVFHLAYEPIRAPIYFAHAHP